MALVCSIIHRAQIRISIEREICVEKKRTDIDSPEWFYLLAQNDTIYMYTEYIDHVKT